jgi:hypothetical protein
VESWADEFGEVANHASAFALASQKFLNPPLEILVVGGAGGSPQAAASREEALRVYHPWRILRHSGLEDGRAELARRGLTPLDGAQAAFCIGSECAGPWPADSDLRVELKRFLSPDGSGTGR